ncbi:MAG: response regulator transcription factor [Terriglobia bacterium]|nr:response regulator transcription factor [Terriglobia bacterium]
MIRILVVDDVEEWRKEIRCLLNPESSLCVVGEAGTGLVAIEETARLKPDLVLLDIGLPDLNGVQVAHRIREVAPDSKIIFVTLNDDADSANRLVQDGAHGYVLKANLQSELLIAIAQVIAGGRFISPQLMN